MDTQKAIVAFSQSEKIKAGIIWISHLLEMLRSLTGPEQQGGQRVIQTMVNMALQEIQLGRNMTGDIEWEGAKKDIEKALVMIHSGVAPEAVTHMTQALSQVTSIGQRSMSFLREQGLV